MQGVTTEDILSAADWSTESTFQKFYYKPMHNTVFAHSVLTATKNTIDIVRLSVLKYNYRMAKTSERLNATPNH